MALYPNGQNLILVNGKIQVVPATEPVMIDSESDLSLPEIAALEPGSMVYTTGWQAAWQKKADGSWVEM